MNIINQKLYIRLSLFGIGLISCKKQPANDNSAANLYSADNSQSAEVSNSADDLESADARNFPLFGCRAEKAGATIQSSPFAEYLATAVKSLAGDPALPGKRVSRLDVRNFYANKPDHPGSKISWLNYDFTLDLGGEGKFSLYGINSGDCRAVNVNVQSQNSQNSELIPSLVRIQSWDDGYPFANEFAKTIMMQGAPLTDKNITEISRILRPGGKAILDLALVDNLQITKLARQLGCEHSLKRESMQGGIYTRIICTKTNRVVNEDL